MKTTFSRTFFTAAIILLAAMLVLAVSFQILIRDFLTEATISDLKKDAQVISNLAAAYSIDGSLSSRDFLLNLDIASQVSDADAVICDSNGTVVLCSDALQGCEHQGLSVNPEYLQKVYRNGGDNATGLIQGLYEDARYIVTIPILSEDSTSAAGIVIVSAPMESTNRILDKIFNIFLSAATFVVLIAVLAVSLFARNQSRPLKDMANAAYAFGHGNLNARVKVYDSYSEEVEELALAFNNMASLLEKSEYQRQEFVANVSHELKTPMTTIGGFIDGILDGTIEQEKEQQYLKVVSDEVKRLSRLVTGMLNMSKIEAGELELKPVKFDISEMLFMTHLSFEQVIDGKYIEIRGLDTMQPNPITADKDMINQVVYNLVDNAVKFTPEAGYIEVSSKSDAEKVILKVKNSGKGIPSEEIGKIFERFYKIDKSRSYDVKGAGMGLYIVKTIIELHGGNIVARSEQGQYAEFIFQLPLI